MTDTKTCFFDSLKEEESLEKGEVSSPFRLIGKEDRALIEEYLSHAFMDITTAENAKDLQNVMKDIRTAWKALHKAMPKGWDSPAESLWAGEDEITCGKKGKIVHIRMPLLPTKKEMSDLPEKKAEIETPLFHALKNAFGHPQVFTERAAIVVVNRTQGNLIDPDNFSYGAMINDVAGFFFVDDSPEYYSLHVFGENGRKDETEVIVLPEKYLPEFVADTVSADVRKMCGLCAVYD